MDSNWSFPDNIARNQFEPDWQLTKSDSTFVSFEHNTPSQKIIFRHFLLIIERSDLTNKQKKKENNILVSPKKSYFVNEPLACPTN